MTSESTDTIAHRRNTDKRFTILCIDDESANLKVLASIFKADYQILISKSAQQGLEKAIQYSPDLILLDVLMPEENGFELIVKLKQHSELNHIPVIFITGLQNVDDEEKGFKLGACDYIQKPFNYSIVRARVHTHLEIIRQRNLLDKFAHFDSLTELPNRRKWENDTEDHWHLAIENSTPLVIGIVDIDCFKLYNDRYGHQQGDIALRKVSSSIKRVLFDYHGQIYRCGGEEFFFCLPPNKDTEVQLILDLCVQSVIDLAILHADSIATNVLSASIGAVQVLPSTTLTIEDTLISADTLLYQVKKSTRNAASFAELNTQGMLVNKDGQLIL